MRNLKKILALVLALVMSLSLMATASAANFTDASSISDTYETAVEVLSGLGVFNGYKEDGSFRPQGSITRAETAAIIYRIVTGDVEDKQVSIYADYNIFTDVASSAWYAGYVNFCANAEYIKGVGGGKFNPQGQVNGYAALAMILRAIGYTANGGFTGPDWAVQTARTAESRKITKNINTSTLGLPATRETVAEILFQAILVNMVDHNVLHTLNGEQGYTETDVTLGYKTFGLEAISGIVTANEYADLYGAVTLADGMTRLNVNGTNYTLNDTTTTLDDIGENCTAYVVPAGRNGTSKVLAIADDPVEYPETVDEVTLTKFLSDNGLKVDSKTEEYLNFDVIKTHDSAYRLKYVLVYDNKADADNDAAVINSASGINSSTNPGFATVAGPNTNGNYTVTRVIPPHTTITGVDLDLMEYIFARADLRDNRFIEGEVYVGTQSNDDISDPNGSVFYSYEKFYAEFIDEHEGDGYTGNENGNRLKVIDNDGDGIADYILKTVYTVAQVSNDRDGVITLDTKNHVLRFDSWRDPYPNTYTSCGNDGDNTDGVNTLTTQPVASADTLKALDVVYYAVIDGKAQTYKIDPITSVKIEKVDHNKLTATSTTGDAYVQAGVHEHIEDEAYEHFVRNLSGNVNYDLYLVNGYLAAFIKTDVLGAFVLLTDGWFNQKIDGEEYAIEIWEGDATGKQSDPILINTNATLFVSEGAPNVILNNNWGALKYFGGTNPGTQPGELNGDTTPAANSVHTIVAALDKENGLIVPVENSSVTGRYQTNILDLYYEGNTTKLPTMASAPGIVYYTEESATTQTAYNKQGAVGVPVRAVTDTVYYTVTNIPGDTGAKVVAMATGYNNAPDITKGNYAGHVEDVYAVGTLRKTDNNLTSNDYYIASIVVIEVDAWAAGKEMMFVVDDTMRYSDVRYRDLQVIREATGKLDNITVDFSGYTGGYWDNIDNHKKVQPGLYYMSKTGQVDSQGKDIWTIVDDNQQIIDNTTYTVPLTHNQVRDTKKVAAGQVDDVTPIGGRNYLVSSDWTWGVSVNSGLDADLSVPAFGNNGWAKFNPDPTGATLRPLQDVDNYDAGTMDANTTEGLYEIGAETPLYTLSYGADWRHNTVTITEYTGADWATVFAPRMNETTSANHPGREDVRGQVNQNRTWFNNNDIMVVYKGTAIVYAISFANLRDNNGNWDDAQNIWLSTIPAAKPGEEVVPFSVTFYGATDTGAAGNDKTPADDKNITVDFDKATATGLDVKGTGVTYFVTNAGDTAETKVPDDPTPAGAQYQLNIKRTADSDWEVWTLILNPGSPAKGLLEDMDNDTIFKPVSGKTILYKGGQDTLKNVMKQFKAEAGAKELTEADWSFTGGNGMPVTVTDDSRWGAGYVAKVTVTAQDGTTETYTILFKTLADVAAELAAKTYDIYSNKVDEKVYNGDDVLANVTYYYTNENDAKTLGYKYGDIYKPLAASDGNPAHDAFVVPAGTEFWTGGDALANAILYTLRQELRDTGFTVDDVESLTAGTAGKVNGTNDKTTGRTCTVVLHDGDYAQQTVTITFNETCYNLYIYRTVSFFARDPDPVYIDVNYNGTNWTGRFDGNAKADWKNAVTAEARKLLRDSTDDGNVTVGGIVTIELISATTPQPAFKQATDGADWYVPVEAELTFDKTRGGPTSTVKATLKVRLTDTRPAVAPLANQAAANALARSAEGNAATVKLSSPDNATNAELGRTAIQNKLRAYTDGAHQIADATITAFEPTAGETTWAATKTWNVTWTGTVDGYTVGGTFICTIKA